MGEVCFYGPVFPDFAWSVLVVHVMKFLRCEQSSVTAGSFASSLKAGAVWLWDDSIIWL